MLFILGYANVAKRSRVVYNPSTGNTKKLKVKDTESTVTDATVSMVKSAIGKYANNDEKIVLYLTNNVAVPIMDALKVKKYVIEKDFDLEDEDQVEEYKTYMKRLRKSGLTFSDDMLTALKKKDEEYTEEEVKMICAITEVAMFNQWTDREHISYLLGLQLSGITIRSLDTLLTEFKKERKGREVVMSPLVASLRRIASELVESCALPELTVVEEEDED